MGTEAWVEATDPGVLVVWLHANEDGRECREKLGGIAQRGVSSKKEAGTAAGSGRLEVWCGWMLRVLPAVVLGRGRRVRAAGWRCAAVLAPGRAQLETLQAGRDPLLTHAARARRARHAGERAQRAAQVEQRIQPPRCAQHRLAAEPISARPFLPRVHQRQPGILASWHPGIPAEAER